MAYKVFLSHSTHDQGLVISLANLLSKHGVEVFFVADRYLTFGECLDDKVSEKIENSDCVVILLTQNGIRSNRVHQDIEYALHCNKLVIPIVEKGIDVTPLQGKEYIEYDPYNYQGELKLKFHSLRKKPTKRFERFELSNKDERSIDDFFITPFTEKLEEFRKNQNKD